MQIKYDELGMDPRALFIINDNGDVVKLNKEEFLMYTKNSNLDTAIKEYLDKPFKYSIIEFMFDNKIYCMCEYLEDLKWENQNAISIVESCVYNYPYILSSVKERDKIVQDYLNYKLNGIARIPIEEQEFVDYKLITKDLLICVCNQLKQILDLNLKDDNKSITYIELMCNYALSNYGGRCTLEPIRETSKIPNNLIEALVAMYLDVISKYNDISEYVGKADEETFYNIIRSKGGVSKMATLVILNSRNEVYELVGSKVTLQKLNNTDGHSNPYITVNIEGHTMHFSETEFKLITANTQSRDLKEVTEDYPDAKGDKLIQNIYHLLLKPERNKIIKFMIDNKITQVIDYLMASFDRVDYKKLTEDERYSNYKRHLGRYDHKYFEEGIPDYVQSVTILEYCRYILYGMGSYAISEKLTDTDLLALTLNFIKSGQCYLEIDYRPLFEECYKYLRHSHIMIASALFRKYCKHTVKYSKYNSTTLVEAACRQSIEEVGLENMLPYEPLRNFDMVSYNKVSPQEVACLLTWVHDYFKLKSDSEEDMVKFLENIKSITGDNNNRVTVKQTVDAWELLDVYLDENSVYKDISRSSKLFYLIDKSSIEPFISSNNPNVESAIMQALKGDYRKVVFNQSVYSCCNYLVNYQGDINDTIQSNIFEVLMNNSLSASNVLRMSMVDISNLVYKLFLDKLGLKMKENLSSSELEEWLLHLCKINANQVLLNGRQWATKLNVTETVRYISGLKKLRYPDALNYIMNHPEIKMDVLCYIILYGNIKVYVFIDLVSKQMVASNEKNDRNERDGIYDNMYSIVALHGIDDTEISNYSKYVLGDFKDYVYLCKAVSYIHQLHL